MIACHCYHGGVSNPYLFTGRVLYRNATHMMALDVMFDERKLEEHPKPIIKKGPHTFWIDAYSRSGGPWQGISTYPSWTQQTPPSAAASGLPSSAMRGAEASRMTAIWNSITGLAAKLRR